MSKVKQIELELKVDGRNAKVVLNNTDSLVKNLVRNSESAASRLSKIGNIATGLNSAMMMGKQVIGVAQEMIDKYKVQEQAEAKLTAALGHKSQALLDSAAAMQKVTTHGDEEIIQAQALIGAFVKDEDQIKLLTKATLDLADAKGMSLVAAADLVSKSVGSSTNALSRYGIAVDGAVGSQERINSLLKNVNKLFGGEAEALANTKTGKMTQATNELSDSMERLGKAAVAFIGPATQLIAKTTSFAVNALLPAKSNLDKATSSAIDQRTQFELLAGTYERLKNKVNKTSVEQNAYKATIDALQTTYPNYLKNVNLEKDSFDKVTTALNKARGELEKYLQLEIKQAIIQDQKKEVIDSAKAMYENDQKILKLKKKLVEVDSNIAKARKDHNESQVTAQVGYRQSLFTDIAQHETRKIELQKEYTDLQNKLLDLESKAANIIPNAPSGNGGTTTTTTGGNGGGTAPATPVIIPTTTTDNSVIASNFANGQQQQQLADAEKQRLTDLNDTKQLYFDAEQERRDLNLTAQQAAGMSEQELNNAILQEKQNQAQIEIDLQNAATQNEFNNLKKEKKVSKEKINLMKQEAAYKKEMTKQAQHQSLSLLISATSHSKALFGVNKALSIAQATINTYEGATKALASGIPPWNIILAAATIASGLADVATISAQQPPSMALGGLISGPLHSAGGVNINAEGGEFVVNRRSAAENYALLDSINRGRASSLVNSSAQGFETIASKLDGVMSTIENQTARLENVEHKLNIVELDESYSNYKINQGSIGNG